MVVYELPIVEWLKPTIKQHHQKGTEIRNNWEKTGSKNLDDRKEDEI